ncbi:MAG: DUF917 domain-containing protein [Thermoplasmata archaeon]
MKTLTIEDTLDILYGCTVLGTGGGGNLANGIQKVEKDFKDGKKLKLVKLDEVPDEGIVASSYFVGAISPESKTKKKDLKIVIENEALYSFNVLEEYKKANFFGIITTELGGGNTATAIDIAMNRDVPLIDADPAGRSVPGVQHSSFYIEKVPIAPLSIVNKFGDIILINQVVDDFRAEELIRSIAAESGNSVGVTSQAVTGKILKKATIPETITLAQKIGHALRNSRNNGADPVYEMIKAGEGALLFEGIVTEDTIWNDENAYTVGEFRINGTGSQFNGHSFRVWFKNENIVSWLDDKPYVTVPDLISVVLRKTGEPISNPYLKGGMEVAVLGFRSPSEWRKEKALEIFTPRAFGFDIPYVPIEKILSGVWNPKK